MLEIKGLRAAAGEKEILTGIDLTVNAGEVQVLAGHPAYTVTAGTVTFQGGDLLDMEPEERAHAGVFLAFQYPVEITGVTNAYFLKAAVNAKRKHQGLPEYDAGVLTETTADLAFLLVLAAGEVVELGALERP